MDADSHDKAPAPRDGYNGTVEAVMIDGLGLLDAAREKAVAD